MAKKKMLCPFSDRACKNCSLYIGRHYMLCDASRYRGHIEDKESGPVKKAGFSAAWKNKDLSVPELEYIEELDPYLKLQ